MPEEEDVLSVGGASSGKSTFIKQLRLHYGDGFPAQARQVFIPHIVDNVTDAFNILLEQMARLGIPFSDTQAEKQGDEFRENHPRLIVHALLQSMSPDDSPTEELGKGACAPVMLNAAKPKLSPSMEIIRNRPSIAELRQLWADRGVQQCYARRAEFSQDLCLSQAGQYFLQHIDRVLASKYSPTIMDILYIRKPTLGVQEHIFNIDNLLYRVIDVAGQKSQRKKWIHFFESVTAVVFFASLAGYNENLEEEKTTNSLRDSLQTFREVAFNQFLERTEFILSSTRDSSAESCAQYIKEQFQRHKPANKRVYTHITCAIDTKMMKKALSDVLRIIVDINMQKIGTF
ncbi:guanine nucleotide-binding protein subunit alpha-11-like [Liolophura sinensis]|uniref:guanine nucleotide-binding protein subunit alpha-11-like n=1 Tax=Liolophura sinensis TaxID=3198878 RepID=UPI003158D4E6